MGFKRKQMILNRKADFEQKLLTRFAFLSKKGVETAKADKDTIVKKWKAAIKAMNKRLAAIAENEKKEADIAKAKAEKAAGPAKEPEGGKAEKPKKAPVEGKEKKAKGEGKPAHPKAAEGGKGHKKPEAGGEGPAS
jgi:uncharacterized membrane protein YukC